MVVISLQPECYTAEIQLPKSRRDASRVFPHCSIQLSPPNRPLAMKRKRSRATSSLSGFPHIEDAIIQHCDIAGLSVLFNVCQRMRDKVSPRLFRHLEVYRFGAKAEEQHLYNLQCKYEKAFTGDTSIDTWRKPCISFKAVDMEKRDKGTLLFSSLEGERRTPLPGLAWGTDENPQTGARLEQYCSTLTCAHGMDGPWLGLLLGITSTGPQVQVWDVIEATCQPNWREYFKLPLPGVNTFVTTMLWTPERYNFSTTLQSMEDDVRFGLLREQRKQTEAMDDMVYVFRPQPDFVRDPAAVQGAAKFTPSEADYSASRRSLFQISSAFEDLLHEGTVTETIVGLDEWCYMLCYPNRIRPYSEVEDAQQASQVYRDPKWTHNTYHERVWFNEILHEDFFQCFRRRVKFLTHEEYSKSPAYKCVTANAEETRAWRGIREPTIV